MTRQIINIGTGPDSYTGDNLRTAFTKVNDNFAQLYAGNVAGNTSINALTANSVSTNGNVNAGNVIVQYRVISNGNISAPYFVGNGRYLTDLTATANLGNLSIGGLTGQTLTGGVLGTLAFRPFAGNAVVMVLETVTPGSFANLSFQGFTNNLTIISTTQANANLKLSANNATITLRGTDNHMGFNGSPSTGYDFNFNGEIRANAFYADADFPVGYQFTTPDGDTGMSHDYQNDVNGNVSLVIIKHNSVPAAKFYDNNHTILSGNLVVSQSGNVFGTFPNAFMQTYSNINSYSQTVFQNINRGPLASFDIVLTASNGNDSAYFGDFGIASNNYQYPGYGLIKPNDVYLQAVGENITGPGSAGKANLILGSTNGDIKMFVGAPEDANVIATISNQGFIPGANVTYNLGSSTRQWKDLWLSNSTMYLGGFPVTVSNTGALSVNGSPVTSSYGNANVASYLPTYTGNIAGNIVKNGYSWTFGPEGTLTLPAGGANIAASGDITIQPIAGQNRSVVIKGGNQSLGTAGGVTIESGVGSGATSVSGNINITASGASTGRGGHVFIRSGSGYTISGDINIIAAAGTNSPSSTDGNVIVTTKTGSWIFGADGNLALPTSGVLLVSGGITAGPTIASPAPYLSGFSSISAQTMTATGNITAPYFLGNGSLLTGLSATYGNANVSTYLSQYDGDINFTSSTGGIANVDTITVLDYIRSDNYQFSNGVSILSTVYGNANVASYLPTYSGNISAGNINITGNIVDTGALSIITGASGNINLAPNSTNTLVVTVSGTNITGTLNVTGNITGGNIITSGSVTGTAANATSTSTATSIGYLGLPQSATATTATLAIGDTGKHIYVTTAGQTITIPANASVAYPIGSTITFIAGPSATTVLIAITTDTMRLAGGALTGTRTLAANGMATAVKVASTTWYINGTGLT